MRLCSPPPPIALVPCSQHSTGPAQKGSRAKKQGDPQVAFLGGGLLWGVDSQGGWRYGRHRGSITVMGSTGTGAIKCERGFIPRWLHKTAGGAEGHLRGGSGTSRALGEGGRNPNGGRDPNRAALTQPLRCATSQREKQSQHPLLPAARRRPLLARQPTGSSDRGQEQSTHCRRALTRLCVERNGREDSHVHVVVPGERRVWRTWAAAPSRVPWWKNHLCSASPLHRGGWLGSPRGCPSSLRPPATRTVPPRCAQGTHGWQNRGLPEPGTDSLHLTPGSGWGEAKGDPVGNTLSR